MSERATINQVAQIGVEATPGNSIPANRLLQALTIEPAIKTTIQQFSPSGAKFNALAALNKEWSEASIGGQMAFNDVVYLLASIFNYEAPEPLGDGSASKWIFAPAQYTPDVIKTYTVEAGSPVRAGKFSYGLVNSFGFTLNRENFELSGSMLGQAYEDDITLTADPTPVDLVPMLATGCDIYMDNDSADLGMTQLTRALTAGFEMGDRFGPLWTINSGVKGFVSHVELKPTTSFRLLVAADDQGMSLLPATRKGQKKFLRLTCTGEPIAEDINYLFQFDVCGIVSEVSEFRDEDGVYAVEWTLTPSYDADWNKAISVEVINTLDSL